MRIVPPLATLELDWNLWGPSWLVGLVAAAALLWVFWLYRLDGRRLTPGRRRFLLAWRILSVLLVLMCLAEPSYKLTTREERSPVAALVVDESMSMSLPDARDNPFVDWYGAKERAEKSRYAAAKKAAELLAASLSKTHEVRVFVTSDGVRPIASLPHLKSGDPPEVSALFKDNPAPTGDYSNLSENLIEVMDRFNNAKLSTVVFLSDGRATDTAALARAADTAAERKVQVNTMGFGTAEPLPDLALLDLVAPPEANVNDHMSVQVTVLNTLRPNLKAVLKLFQDDGKEPLVSRELTLPLGELRVGLTTLPKREGEIKYTLALPVFPEELDPENNALTFYVNVVKRKLKVLFIAGAPTMEFHHIVPALIRDRVMDVSCFLQSADVNAVHQGDDVIAELPRAPAEWTRYDVVILYDIDPNQFSNEQENGLEELVQSGGGVFFIAGRTHGLAALMQVRGPKMRAMLPVEINKSRHPDYDEYYTEPFSVVRTAQGQRHPMLIFASNPKTNDEVWQSLADLDFYWHHPVMEVKRQAIPLLTKASKSNGGASGECVMALMRYGKGSSVYLGVHTMWLWRFPMESYDYDQFWSQTCRYLAEYRLLGAQRQVLLNTDKKLYAPGETARVQLAILDPALASQLRNEQLFATVTDEAQGEYKVMLQSSEKDPSAYYGFFPVRRLGDHGVRVQHILAADLAAKKALFDEKKHFTVRMQSLEFKDTTADLHGLKELAERTGGTAWDHTNMGEGVKQLPGTVNADPQWIPHESFDDLWDRWYVLALFLVCATVELWFRRNWGLL